MKKNPIGFILPIFIFSLLILLVISCTSDELPIPQGCSTEAPTYTHDVKSIIDQTCSYSRCHDGSGGIGPGDYTSYDGIKTVMLNGTFTERTIDLRNNPSLGMPPDISIYPESRQDDLSEVQLAIVLCWIQNGFPE